MIENDYLEMMIRCRTEIIDLRNQTINAKLEAYDRLIKVVALLPAPSPGYAEDLEGRFTKEIEKVREIIAGKKGAASDGST